MFDFKFFKTRYCSMDRFASNFWKWSAFSWEVFTTCKFSVTLYRKNYILYLQLPSRYCPHIYKPILYILTIFYVISMVIILLPSPLWFGKVIEVRRGRTGVLGWLEVRESWPRWGRGKVSRGHRPSCKRGLAC